MPKPTRENVRAKLTIRDIPSTTKKERLDLALWLDNMANSLRQDNPDSYADTYTARYITVE